MTVAQQFIDKKIEYLEYDFEARKDRRENLFLDRNIAKENLLLFRDILYKEGVEFFLLYGTLLGAVREKDFLSYDTDTDIGILEKDREAFIKVIPKLLNNGFEIIRTKAPDDLITFMRKDEYIDVGIFRKEKGYFKYQNNYIKEDFFKEFEKIDFLGKEFLVPKDYTLLLREWYGENWKVPIKNFPSLPEKGYKKSLILLKRKFFHSKFYNKIRPFIKRKK